MTLLHTAGDDRNTAAVTKAGFRFLFPFFSERHDSPLAIFSHRPLFFSFDPFDVWPPLFLFVLQALVFQKRSSHTKWKYFMNSANKMETLYACTGVAALEEGRHESRAEVLTKPLCY